MTIKYANIVQGHRWSCIDGTIVIIDDVYVDGYGVKRVWVKTQAGYRYTINEMGEAALPSKNLFENLTELEARKTTVETAVEQAETRYNSLGYPMAEYKDEDTYFKRVLDEAKKLNEDDYHEYRKDEGKLPVAEIFKQFPLAIEELARVIAFGATKYETHSWVKIPNFIQRAEQSLVRHLLEHLDPNADKLDSESKQLHLVHSIWNALAIVQTMKENENE